MSTLINLLPDLRQAKLRDLRRRQMAIGVGVSVCVLCGSLVGLLSIYMAGQKVVINTVSSAIDKEKAELEEVDGLIEAMTANEHLASLPKLYGKRVFLSKFFKAYSEANPASITIDSLTIDGENVLKVSGNAPSYVEIAKLARALEASNVTVGEGAAATNKPYFTNIAIGGVTRSEMNVAAFTLSATISSGVVTDGYN